MVEKFIIAKYASEECINRMKNSIFTADHSVYNSYSAKQLGITTQFYDSKEHAEHDLAKLEEYNPTANYGVVLVEVY